MIRLRGKVFEALRRRLRRSRKKFAELSLRDQRVAIARDVIAQLDARRLIAHSCYFDVWGHGPYEIEMKIERAFDDEIDLSLVTAQAPCMVCGIGSLFVVAVEKADVVDSSFVGEADPRPAQVEYLRRWFDEEQLAEIEAWFETKEASARWRYIWNENPNHPILAGDVARLDSGGRLRRIMENIVSNRGKFDPTRGMHSGRVRV